MGRAHVLRRRLPRSTAARTPSRRRCVHRGGRREPGLRRAGAVDQPDRPRHRRRLRRPGGGRPAAGPVHARRPTTRAASARPAPPAGRRPPGTAPPALPGRPRPRAARRRRPRRRPPAPRLPDGRRRGGRRRAARRWKRSSGSTRSPAGCGASARGTASRTSARSFRTRSRRPTSSPTRPQRGDDEKLRDELGDVLFQVVFLSLLLEERGAGSLAAVAEEITREADPPPSARLRRGRGGDVRRGARNWDRIKREVEGRGADDPFADVPENLPGLLYARKILRRADPEGGAPPPTRERRDEAEAAVGELLLERGRALAPARASIPSSPCARPPTGFATAPTLASRPREWAPSSTSTHARSSIRGATRRSRSTSASTPGPRAAPPCPPGASTGEFEATELRDGGEAWAGKGVGKAVENVNDAIAEGAHRRRGRPTRPRSTRPCASSTGRRTSRASAPTRSSASRWPPPRPPPPRPRCRSTPTSPSSTAAAASRRTCCRCR